MTTARQEVLAAFQRLEAETGRNAFAFKEVVAEVFSVTSAYRASTIQTYVVSVMCADAPVHHANHTDDLRRVGRGLYALNASAAVDARPAPPPLPPSIVEEQPQLLDGHPWYWEGSVQAAIISGLAGAGWQIRSVSDTASRVQGTDIVASLNNRSLHIEVKGYPSETYARGEKKGQPKPTHPATQARVWFAGALLKAAMLRDDHPADAVAIGFPSFGTYRTLAERISTTLRGAAVGLVWVDESGDVELNLSDRPA